MDVAPHPHMGLQTVSWLLEGEVLHHDSLGFAGPARPGVLNLMTAGRGIAHAEETPSDNTGRLRGVQLWVALPEASRETAPAFDQHLKLPVAELEGGQATLIMGELAGVRSPARAFSPIVGADLAGKRGRRLVFPLDPGFEHALVLLQGGCRRDRGAAHRHALLSAAARNELVIHSSRVVRVLLSAARPSARRS
jgi:redox-sensitive bicupin YhaK (pirin superfamily)